MKQTSVIVGKLADPHHIETQEGQNVKINEWAGRATWAYLRLVYGRQIDSSLTATGPEREDCAYELMRTAARDGRQVKPLQFIMSSSDVAAVASMKHLLIEPRKVYETAAQILGPAAAIQPTHNLHGETFMTGQGFAGLKTGYQVDGGDLITRQAVRVGVFARVELCFNPLSWLGVSSIARFGVPTEYERVLRIQKLNELFLRLRAAITNAKGQLKDLEQRVEHTKAVSLSSKNANMINGAFCLAYGLGEKTIKSVMEQYGQEPKTQYGLAMAQSWQAQHGEHRETPQGMKDKVPQSLSTISGATLLIDPKTAAPKIRTWLEGQQSELAKQLLKGKLA